MKTRFIILLMSALPCASIFTMAQDIEPQNTTMQTATDSIPELYEQLDEFVIEAKKDIVKSDGAKLTYSLDDDDSSKGQTLLDALRKVPMVSVDGQDNIYIKGSQNFKIFVNGKEDPMLTANASKILKAMPAEAASKIEVITEPGARYDAEGVGGILNIVTERKQTKEGYTGSISLSASTQNFATSLYGRGKYGNVTADVSVNYANNSLQKQENINENEIRDYSSKDYYLTRDRMSQSIFYNYLGGDLNLSWEPTDKDLLTVGGHINYINANLANIDDRKSIFSEDGTLKQFTLQKITGALTNLGATATTGYRRIFDKPSHSLTLAYMFSYGFDPMKMDYHNSSENPQYYIPDYQSSDNTTYRREHTVTADYTNSFREGKHVLEAGLKGVFRNNDRITLQYLGPDPSELRPLEDNTGKTTQLQDIYAAYATYKGTFGSLMVSGGLRYEQTVMKMYFPFAEANNFSRNLKDVVPNAALTYMFGAATNIRLAYQMRINRPQIGQMSPIQYNMTQTYVQIGNPELESEHYNNISLTYTNYGRVLGGNVALNLYQSDNTISDYTYYKDGVSYETYGNYGKSRQIELSGFLNCNITNKMSLSLNASVNFTSLKAEKQNLSNHGWTGNYGVNYNYSGPWDMKYTLYGGQSTGYINLQGKFCGWYYYGLGISKELLKDKSLKLSLGASNFLTKYARYKTLTNTASTSSISRFANRAWNVSVSVSWNFGKLSDQVKKTSASLETNDSKSGGNKTSIGI